MNKLKSRKFWLTVASVLASIGASITGMINDNKILSYIGIICTVVSTAIYAGCEAYIDGARVSSSSCLDAYNDCDDDLNAITKEIDKDIYDLIDNVRVDSDDTVITDGEKDN